MSASPQTINTLTIIDDPTFAFPPPTSFGHDVKDVLVIDWLTFITDCTAACTVGVEIQDANAIAVWKGIETLAANSSTTMHVSFDKGLPFKGTMIELVTSMYAQPSGHAARQPTVLVSPGTGYGENTLFIGFHFENPTLRS